MRGCQRRRPRRLLARRLLYELLTGPRPIVSTTGCLRRFRALSARKNRRPSLVLNPHRARPASATLVQSRDYARIRQKTRDGTPDTLRRHLPVIWITLSSVAAQRTAAALRDGRRVCRRHSPSFRGPSDFRARYFMPAREYELSARRRVARHRRAAFQELRQEEKADELSGAWNGRRHNHQAQQHSSHHRAPRPVSVLKYATATPTFWPPGTSWMSALCSTAGFSAPQTACAYRATDSRARRLTALAQVDEKFTTSSLSKILFRDRSRRL